MLYLYQKLNFKLFLIEWKTLINAPVFIWIVCFSDILVSILSISCHMTSQASTVSYGEWKSERIEGEKSSPQWFFFYQLFFFGPVI